MTKSSCPDTNTLKELYYNQSLTQAEIGARFGVYQSTVGRWLRQLDIPARSRAEAAHMKVANHVDLSETALSFMSGLLLGDGSLSSRSEFSAYYSHSSKYHEYLEWLVGQLGNFGVKIAGKINKRVRYYHDEPGRSPNIFYSICTCSYVELGDLKTKWYPEPERKKHPPRDLVLAPLTLRQWFIGDGSYVEGHRSGSLYRTVWLTNLAFSKADRRFLLNLLHRAGIGAVIVKRGFQIRTRSLDRFFNYIGPCPVEDIYDYKWPSVEITHGQLDLL